MMRHVVQIGVRLAVGLVLVSVFVFLIVRLLPGDVVTTSLSNAGYTRQELATERARLGLDQPFYKQYATWLGNIVRLNLGRSPRTHQQISRNLADRLPVTVELTVFSALIAFLLGIVGGTFSAIRRGTGTDHVLRAIAMAGISLPSFLVASISLLVLSKYFHWIPSLKYHSLTQSPRLNLQQFLLPSLILGVWAGALLTRMTRTAVLDVLTSDFVRTAHAKGLSSRTVTWRHILRNAWPPIVVMLGLIVAQLLSGTVVVEEIFGLPGIGGYVVTAVQSRDYDVVQAVALVTTIAIVFVNAAVDFTQIFLDPKVGAA